MDDIMQFLIVLGVIAIGIYQQYKKEAAKKASERSVLPAPPTATPRQAPASSRRKRESFLPTGDATTSSLTGSVSASPCTPNTSISPISTPPQPETESDYAIHSAEEARRAIIWSEILQRKY
ncbi:MAG: hypothetical protein LBM06_08045 [Prevotellaceae bacterium]|jgi:hypothetical protein|nr:hypothetical protein [Prevotellaceae bacterium]